MLKKDKNIVFILIAAVALLSYLFFYMFWPISQKVGDQSAQTFFPWKIWPRAKINYFTNKLFWSPYKTLRRDFCILLRIFLHVLAHISKSRQPICANFFFPERYSKVAPEDWSTVFWGIIVRGPKIELFFFRKRCPKKSL